MINWRIVKKMATTSLFSGLSACSTLFVATSMWTTGAHACGGFFCQTIPIEQAGEQIVFRQEGSDITAMIRILYTGVAEDFSWVVPVPNDPQLSVGSDTFFDQLEGQTRPQFNLETRGQACAVPFPVATVATDAASESAGDTDDGNVSVREEVVGPFDVQIITSDDAGALAAWLAANDYDLTERGEELIAPYVEENMQFVALKLRNGQTSGSIQPLIMRYQGESPVIPIRLTGVAAQDDMGVLTWVIGDRRAVPDNYLHVVPNYGRINWFGGNFSAFASYQGLITAAMDEAGGQGFATDLAGMIDPNIADSFNDPAVTQQVLNQAQAQPDAAGFISEIMSRIPQQNESRTFLQSQLPIPAGFDASVYFSAASLQLAFSAEELNTARSEFQTFIETGIIQPLSDSIALVPPGAYMTRLSTTLSPEEMTLDPAFVFNPSMADQSQDRNAVLDLSCTDNGTEWQLTLGEGTDRDGEVVAQGISEGFPFIQPPELIQQPAVSLSEDTSADALPVTVARNSFTAVSNGEITAFPALTTDVTENPGGGDTGSSGGSGAGGPILVLLISCLVGVRRFGVGARA